jgi:hypothetical protein
VLPASSAGWTPLLQATACRADWRLIELWSDLPFDLETSWSAGDATGMSATCTVARSGRLCVYAASLDLRVLGRSEAAGKVSAVVVDTFHPTENVHQTDGEPVEEQQLAVMPAASRLRLELASHEALSTARLRLLDPDGTVRTDIPGDAQPSGGLLVGGAAAVVVSSPQSRWRLLTLLNL